MPRRFVLFDFDGVIADALPLAYDVARTMHPHMTREEYIPLWDENIYESTKKLNCGPDCRRSAEEFFAEYTPRRDEIQIVAGAKEMVQRLATDYTLCVISSSLSLDVMAFLERFEIAQHFADILGMDVHESKIERINTILARYDATQRDCVFVTDTVGDMREARKSGIDAIAVSWGFQPGERLAKESPVALVERPADLPAAVAVYFENAYARA
ncbi:MAG: HAD family hydrolase [Candidatus Kaiserbacteria bacterium]|nr:HAD family hydrolase [Candidatus Kaiserbacteria bacterium]